MNLRCGGTNGDYDGGRVTYGGESGGGVDSVEVVVIVEMVMLRWR